MASGLAKRTAEEPPTAPTPAHKRVKGDSTLNSPGGAPSRHISSVHSPAGLPARPTHAREQVIWLKDPPPPRSPIQSHPIALKLLSEVKVCRFQPDS